MDELRPDVGQTADGRHGPRSPLDWIGLARQQWDNDRAMQMAAALSFRTLFGLLPVIVVATVLVKALGMEDYYLGPLGKLFAFAGLDHVRIIPPPGSGLTGATTLDVWLQDRVRDAKQVNVAAIGWIGVAVTLYAAISLMVTIENCCNIIYRAPRGRPWTSRIPIYWFVLTLSPLMVIFSTYLDTRFQQTMTEFELHGRMTSTIGFAWTLFAVWLLMFVSYMLFPNTRVHPKPAMIGAIVSASLLEAGKRTMGAYLENAMSLSQLYGSLGLVPLFMFWVYLMWLAVLLGLEVSALLQQHVPQWRFEARGGSGSSFAGLDTESVTEFLNRIVATVKTKAPGRPENRSANQEPACLPGDLEATGTESTIPLRRELHPTSESRPATSGTSGVTHLLHKLHDSRSDSSGDAPTKNR